MSLGLDLAYALVLAMVLAAGSGGDAAPSGTEATVFHLASAARHVSPELLPTSREEGLVEIVKAEGPAIGLGDLSGRIFTTSAGRHYVPQAEDRAAIAALRSRPDVIAALTAMRAMKLAGQMGQRLGRPARIDEVAAALVLGAPSAAALIGALEARPDDRVAVALPEIAARRPELAFSRQRSRTVRDLFAAVSQPFRAAAEAHASATTGMIRSSSASGGQGWRSQVILGAVSPQ